MHVNHEEATAVVHAAYDAAQALRIQATAVQETARTACSQNESDFCKTALAPFMCAARQPIKQLLLLRGTTQVLRMQATGVQEDGVHRMCVRNLRLFGMARVDLLAQAGNFALRDPGRLEPHT